MKTIVATILILISISALCQEIIEKEVKTKVNEVTVFIEGAQITSNEQVNLTSGTTILKFTGLSPYIDGKSIKVKSLGKVTVLSVNHQLNYIDPVKKNTDIQLYEKQIVDLESKIELENTYLSILKEETDFLSLNKKISSSENELTLENLKATNEYYKSRISEIKLTEIKHRKTIEALSNEKNKLSNQIRNLQDKRENPTGEVLIKVEANASTTAKFSLSYMVSNAGWFPSYDIRANSIGQPIEIIYKANVHQNTKVDWKDAKIKFSSHEPEQSLVAPELKNYILSYYTLPPVYGKIPGQVYGRVTDGQNNPLPGVNVLVKGTTLGTITDLNGNYQLTLPANSNSLYFSYVGFLAEEKQVNSERTDVQLIEDVTTLDEVVVVGYGTQRKSTVTGAVSSIGQVLPGRVSGVNVRGTSSISNQSKSNQSIPLQVEPIRNQTGFEFDIETPYTILSDNKNYSINMQTYYIPAEYEYICIPKITEAAFLQAYLTNYQQYNFLEGEANIFFEDTYIGKSILDVRYLSDTLTISFGRDKNVLVKRSLVKDFSERKILSGKRFESKAWNIHLKNNRSEEISVKLLDQVPVSVIEEIKVEVAELSKGKLNEETGTVIWKLKLNPAKEEKLDLKYTVEYPKNNSLVVE